VLVASGAKVLGSMRIGRNSRIGAGSVVLKEVPPNSTVVGIPGRIVVQDGVKVGDNLDHINLPDPVADKFQQLEKDLIHLKRDVKEMREKQKEKEKGKV
jgi:serine O-acetyltransferase